MAVTFDKIFRVSEIHAGRNEESLVFVSSSPACAGFISDRTLTGPPLSGDSSCFSGRVITVSSYHSAGRVIAEMKYSSVRHKSAF